MSAEAVINVKLSVVEFGRFVFNEILAGMEPSREEAVIRIPYAFPTTTSSMYSIQT